MDLNKIASLNKEELLKKLKQRRFDDVVQILEDKDIDGQKFLNLREFEIFKWKLNPAQKRALWGCIKEIKENPHTLLIREKPNINKRPPSIKERKPENNESDKEQFKGKLKFLLGSAGTTVGSSSTLPKTGKPKASLPAPIETGREANKSSSKPLPPSPPPPPLPRNGVAKNTSGVVKKHALPLPKEVPSQEPDQMYLQMHAPPELNDESNEDYLTPDEISSPSNFIRKSPNLPKRGNPSEGIPRHLKTDDKLKFRSAEALALGEDPEETYENLDQVYESVEMPVSAPGRKFPLQSEKTVAGYKQLSNSENSLQMTLKDLKSTIVVQDNNAPQQEHILSFLTSKLNPFKAKTKPKNLYENHTLPTEVTKSPTQQPAKNRPLPNIPTTQNTLFSRPFPPPRPLPDPEPDVLPDPNPLDNYVTLTNVVDQPPISMEFNHSDEDMEEEEQIYENRPKPQDSVEEEEIYQNSATGNDSNEEQSIYENTSDLSGKIPPSASKTKRFAIPTSTTPSQYNVTKNTGNRVNTSSGHDYQPPKIQDLALLLSERLREREKMNTVVIDSDSEFDEDPEEQPIYGNIYEDEEDPIPEVVKPAIPMLAEDSKIPIYKRALPEIPKRNESSKIPSIEKKDEFPKGPMIANKSSSPRGPVIPKTSGSMLSTVQSKNAMPAIPSTSGIKMSTVPNNNFPNAMVGTAHNTKMINKNDESQKAPAFPNKNLNKPLRDKDKQFNPNPVLELPAAGHKNYELHRMTGSGYNSQLTQSGQSKEEIKPKNNLFDLSEEPFYRNIDRKGAKQLLAKYGNGAFLFRPSRTYFLVLTVKHSNKIYNFGIQRTADNMLRLNTEGDIEAPQFSSLREFVDYFSDEPVTFENEELVIEIRLTTAVPPE